MDLQDLSNMKLDQHAIDNYIKPALNTCIDELCDKLTAPATDKEKPHGFEELANLGKQTFTGTYEQVNDWLYRNGWTDGSPVIPPTREAVDKMLTGTPMPADYVVAELHPSGAPATVEKIAINAIMAGCSPIHMPALIAAVEATKDVNLEGWTCSVQSWMGPFIVINGPAAKDLGMETQGAALAPYTRTQSCVAKAFAYILMNISGVRPRMEDMTYLGGETRFGFCFAEDEENSPWPPLQCDYGFDKDDSTVNIFWPVGRELVINPMRQSNAAEIIAELGKIEDPGFYPGATYCISAKAARTLADAGFTKQKVYDHLVEYTRRSVTQEYIDWETKNNHPLPGGLPLPVSTDYTIRKFYDDSHLQLIVVGDKNVYCGVAYIGTGDHGGPATKKMLLPENWDKLVAEYAELKPEYVKY